MYNDAIRLRPFSAAYHVQTVNDRLAVKVVKHLIQNRKRRHINASTSNLNVSGTDAAQPT